MDLALAIAQGFHNAPRLYGDTTVRRPTRISGYRSGLRAAGEEFAFGIYDGVTGLVRQPYHGAKEGGALGFVEGIGKGIGGFVLKDLAAIIGPVGYTMKGVHKELIKGKQPTAFIRKARIIQGGKDVRSLDEKEIKIVRERMDAAWVAIMEIKKEYDKTKKEGLIKRIALARESRRIKQHGGFESVGKAQRAMKKWEGSRKKSEEKGRSESRHLPDRQANGTLKGVTSSSAAKQEHHAKREVDHARTLATENQENAQAPPSSTTKTNEHSTMKKFREKRLDEKGVEAADFAPEIPAPTAEDVNPIDLGKHIDGNGTSDVEGRVGEGKEKRHRGSLPTHGVTLGGL